MMIHHLIYLPDLLLLWKNQLGQIHLPYLLKCPNLNQNHQFVLNGDQAEISSTLVYSVSAFSLDVS